MELRMASYNPNYSTVTNPWTDISSCNAGDAGLNGVWPAGFILFIINKILWPDPNPKPFTPGYSILVSAFLARPVCYFVNRMISP